MTSSRFSPHDGAAFVSAPNALNAAAPYFRREFHAQDGLLRATLHATALGIVEPYVNGARVGDAVLAPGWTSYRHRVMVTTIDVTDVVRVGANALGAIVGEGWAVGRLGWEGRSRIYADRPELFLRLELLYPDRTVVIGTDSEFRVGTGAIIANSIYDGETYDARLEPVGWAEPGFDDATWLRAEPTDRDPATLELQAAPPIRRIEELAPVDIRESPSGRTIVDFGQNISGWIRLTVAGDAGRVVTIRHAEILTPDGDLETETNRTAAATDRYTLRGGETETWEPRFTFHGFRYVEIDGWPGAIAPDALRAVVVHTDMRRTGWFETSHPLISRLHENVVWSMRGNFVGVPTDCPQRDERLGWTGDINAFTPTASYLYDVRGILGSWLQDLRAEQREKGSVPWVVPDALETPSPPTALWSDAAVSVPWALYEEYGDLNILRDAYDSMATLIRQIASKLDEAGLWSSGFQFGDWLDPDAPAENPTAAKTDRHLVASAYLCRTTREMADTARLLDRAADAEEFANLAARVRDAFRREYVTPAGRLAMESATAYALAICFDILSEDQLPKAGARLADLVANSGFRISTGFAGTPLVADALTTTGHLDSAYRLLLEEECPSFLYPVTMGATTIWERWDSVLPDGTVNATGMTSLNHYALGAIAHWLHRVVGGLQRVEPGYRRIRIAPRPGGGLTWARTAHETPHGRIEVSWVIENEQLTVEAVIPDGVEAEIDLPAHGGTPLFTAGPGTHRWTVPAAGSEGGPAAPSLDTPLRDLARLEGAWPAAAEVLLRHFPGLPLDASSPAAANLTLRGVLDLIPGVPESLEQELNDALSSERP
ncbi:glycoside hydrolase family 78 protein [Microbacterium sp.]|uniref:glycoside hydrolase family 78 protein n=1 Tax=Microbacterium sp. TaxID=51671 RepID=UPI002615F6AE|nr:glycoside hydrolase family 78 protein [Microbacterium sp.]